ncbi:hypothetical protein [Streptomyces sp. NPDC005859]|uniref:hypothetical protein n=1 Tax=Streptomyces sp. NPDC005859 TaxID=3157170 RepID=UPI0033E65307
MSGTFHSARSARGNPAAGPARRVGRLGRWAGPYGASASGGFEVATELPLLALKTNESHPA